MASLSRRLLLQVCARDSANHLPAGWCIARGNGESVNGDRHPELYRGGSQPAKSVKTAPVRLIQQVQQRGFEVFHLLFRLGAGFGCIRGEHGTEPGDLIRKPVVLSRQDRNLSAIRARAWASSRSCSRRCARSRQSRMAAVSALSLMLSRTLPLRRASALGSTNGVA